ncbi:MAG: hypothetical protein ACKOFW_02560, partial [Planctomycetaceae bacterium]
MAAKSNKALGAALLVALGVGAYLGNLIPKLGWGTGSGWLGQAPDTLATATTEKPRSPASTPDSSSDESPAEEDANEPPVLVRIDGHDLLLRGADGEFQPTDAAEIVRRAVAATPAAGSPRLRIELTPRSRAKAETELQQALRDVQVDA